MKFFERYQNLDGSTTKFREHKLEKPLRVIFRLENILPTAYITAATVPAYATSARQAFTVAAVGAAGLALHLLYQHGNDRLTLLRFRPAEEKCIDRKPTGNTAPTTPDNLRKAQGVVSDAKFMTCLWALNVAAYDHAQLLSGNPRLSSLFLMAFVLGTFARRASQLHAYNQVVKGKWVLCDAPPPRKVTESKKETSFLGKISPI